MTLQWKRQTRKRCYHCRNFSETAVAELESGVSRLCREKKTKMNRQCDLTHPSLSWTQTGRWILRSRPLCEPAHGKHRRWGGWGPWCRCSLMRFLWCGSFFHSGPTAGQGKKKNTIQLIQRLLLLWRFSRNEISRTVPHLLIVLDLILQDDPVGFFRWLPGQGNGVSCDILGLNWSHWRGSWWDDQRKRKQKRKKMFSCCFHPWRRWVCSVPHFLLLLLRKSNKPRGNRFHFSLNLALIQNQGSCETVRPHSWFNRRSVN